MSQPIRVSIVGGSGYAGGELLRILMQHERVAIHEVTSSSRVGDYVHRAHPNLRGFTDLRFTHPNELSACDFLFLCQPHGISSTTIDALSEKAERIVDLAADFRLGDSSSYAKWYGHEHPAPSWLDQFVYGLPETRREQIRTARYVSGVGCNATAMNLALLPLARAGLIRHAVCDLKVGSTEAGASANPGSHHPERAGAVRAFAPVGHRHQAEVEQECGTFDLDVSITSVEMTRGVVCTAHVFPTEPVGMKDLWRLYRGMCADEPFVRLVREQNGLHRLPEPRILAGTNIADIGFDLDARSGRIVSICALDNLVKGAAGTAVQCMNLMHGFAERTGLNFMGLHPR